MDDILKLDATVLAGRIADGTLTAEALMIATLDHVDALNPALNAIVSRVDRETLLAQARAADAGPRKGPLHGLPIAVKDLADVAGIPTSMGCAALAGMVPRTSDVMVQRMIDAGAIVIGKTNTPEFGLGSHT
jgi:amidase